MKITKTQARRRKFFGPLFWLAVVILLVPIIGYGISYAEGGNHEAAWTLFTEESAIGRRRSISWLQITWGAGLALVLLGLVGLVGLFKRSPDATRSRTLDLGGDSEIEVQLNSPAKRTVGPYTEVYLNDQFLAGLMGKESVVAKVPAGEHKVRYKTAMPGSIDESNRLMKTVAAPLEDPIQNPAPLYEPAPNVVLDTTYQFEESVPLQPRQRLICHCTPLWKKMAKDPTEKRLKRQIVQAVWSETENIAA